MPQGKLVKALPHSLQFLALACSLTLHLELAMHEVSVVVKKRSLLCYSTLDTATNKVLPVRHSCLLIIGMPELDKRLELMDSMPPRCLARSLISCLNHLKPFLLYIWLGNRWMWLEAEVSFFPTPLVWDFQIVGHDQSRTKFCKTHSRYIFAVLLSYVWSLPDFNSLAIELIC